MSLERIKQLHRITETNLFLVTGTLDYSRLIDAIALLADQVHDYDDGSDSAEAIWYLESLHCASIDSILVGAYWHLTEWHAGQSSNTYSALCRIGTVFNPGMTQGPEPESSEFDVYNELERMAMD